ncbi:MAG: hypothetical protein ACXWZB_05095 [Gaiellaceae bacterium]
MNVRITDESDFGFGWSETAKLQRTSHALVEEGRVWIVDPLDGAGVDDRIRALGTPVGVIQLLNRHARDSEVVAARFGVPLHIVPSSLPRTPFQCLPVVRNRFWQEVALWWPARRVLLCADVLGTIPFFRAGGEPVGMHPLLRLRPPSSLRGLGVEQLLVGHGDALTGVQTPTAVEDALRHARRRIPRWLAGVPRIVRAGY